MVHELVRNGLDQCSRVLRRRVLVDSDVLELRFDRLSMAVQAVIHRAREVTTTQDEEDDEGSSVQSLEVVVPLLPEDDDGNALAEAAHESSSAPAATTTTTTTEDPVHLLGSLRVKITSGGSKTLQDHTSLDNHAELRAFVSILTTILRLLDHEGTNQHLASSNGIVHSLFAKESRAAFMDCVVLQFVDAVMSLGRYIVFGTNLDWPNVVQTRCRSVFVFFGCGRKVQREERSDPMNRSVQPRFQHFTHGIVRVLYCASRRPRSRVSPRTSHGFSFH